MKTADIEALKRWAKDFLSPAGDVGGPFCMTNYSARELGKALLELIQERESLVGLACELRKERDSLREVVENISDELVGLRWRMGDCEKERDSLRVERDELKAAKAAVDEHHAECCAYSANLKAERDACILEIDGLKKSVRVGDCAVLGLRKVKEERDSLRKKLLQAELSIESLINERDFLRGKVDGFSSEIGIFAKELQATCQVLIDKCTKAGGGIS